MDGNVKNVIDYYQSENEDDRMENQPLEFLRSKEIIARYLAKESMDIIDIGGATGPYSFWLASLGHKVALVDFTPKHIEIAREHEKSKGMKLASSTVGDARELPYEDSSMDLALLMGPLYHLVEKTDRVKAISEACRVLKPGGRIICAVISRFASMTDGFLYDLIRDPEFVSIMREDLNSGRHKNPGRIRHYFTDAYFHRPEEVSLELSEGGFIFEELVAIEGVGNMIPNVSEKMGDPAYREILFDTLRKVEREPSMMGISSHLMGVGRKPVE